MKIVRLMFCLAVLVCIIERGFSATVAFWDFEDGTPGATFYSVGGAEDSSGNDYTMYGEDVPSGPSFSQAGETATGVGLSAVFNGSQSGYTTDNAINGWSPTSWTIEVSVKLDDLSGWLTMIGRHGSSQDEAASDFYLQKNGEDGAFRINFDTEGGERYILDSDFTPAAGQWYHLAVVSDGSTVTMYADKLDGNGYQSVGSLEMNGGNDNTLAATDYNWTFGCGWFDGNPADYIDGNLDDIRFSDTALSPEEFLHHSPVTITESQGVTVLYLYDTGQTDSYDISLLEEPTDDVNITVAPAEGLSVGNGSGVNKVLTFTTADWDQARTVEVEIADPCISFDDSEQIQHTCRSDDSQYDGVPVRDVSVNIEEDDCGTWGYPEVDYNFDCRVNLKDFASLAKVWQITDSPLDLNSFVRDWLADTFSYDEELYSRSIQESSQPFFVDPANVLNTIDEKIYGQFLEHIYHSVNGGLWGELVWNRSFEMSDSETGGIWSIDGAELVQSSTAADVHLEFGDTSWEDYEVTLEARKDGGDEGFLVLFRSPDEDNFYWCNFGGWGNTQHVIEKEINGSRSAVSSSVSGSISTGKWYDVRIRCEGNNFRVWLDENQIIDYTDNSGVFMGGRIGVGTWRTQSRFRNIKVTDISGSTVLYSGLPDLPEGQYLADFWESFGDGEFSVDDTDALNDDYSIEIVSDGGSTGIRQDDYKFTRQPYYGSLWMKGSVPSGLEVEFLDGTTSLGQATLPEPSSSWEEYTFQITPSAATEQGSLRISLLGAGTVNIDQVSLMGQDSNETGGYRPDLLQAVDDLKAPVIRWPGGCYASAYFWKDGIGPQHTRHKYPITLWDDQDTNSYGTDEFLRMCEALGVEPIIVINTGILDVTCGVTITEKLANRDAYIQDAVDWIEYCNGPVDSTWGAERAANGHPEPYNVKYWEIDNETWLAGAEDYSDVVLDFAPAMLAEDPNIKIIACGGSSFDQGWNQTVIDNCAGIIDYISVHHYEDASNFKSGPRNYEDHIVELGDYIAASSNPDIKIYMSEWNAQTTDMRTGLYAGGLLNAFERTGDVFEIGGPALFLRHTSASAWDNAFINFDHTGWFAAPNYVVMKLWRQHYAPKCVETTGDDTDLNVVSVLSGDEQMLYIRVVNPDAEDKSVEFEIDDSFAADTAYMHYVAPGSLSARNTLSDPDTVRVEAKVIGLDGQVLRFIMPGYSAGVVTVRTAQSY